MQVQRTALFSALSAALLAFSVSAQAQSVSVKQANNPAAINDLVTVDFVASGFPDLVFGGGFNIAWDPSIVSLQSIAIPNSWEFFRSAGLHDPASGTVSDLNFNTFSNPIKGDFLTASATFKVIGAGISPITLTPSGSFPFGDEFGNAVTVSFNNGTIGAVPEPSSVMLLLAGMACTLAMARRRKA